MTPSVNWQRCRQYTEWLKALPPNLQGSALADALQAICDLDKLQAIAPARLRSRLTIAPLPTSRTPHSVTALSKVTAN
jgi:hypothetical protein